MTTPLTPREAIIAAAEESVALYIDGDWEIEPDQFALELDRLGYKVMPKEPTDEIEQIIQDAVDNCETAAYIYRAAIAAAPKLGGENG